MKRKLFSRCFLGIILVNFVACTDIDLSNGFSRDVKLQESIVLPVGDVNITLGDLLSELKNQSLLSYDHDSILLQVTDSADVDFPKINLGSTFTAFETSYSPFPVSATLNPPYSFPTIETTSNIELGLNANFPNERVDSVWVKSMNIAFTLNSNILQASNYKIRLTFPGNKLRNRNGSALNAIEVTPTVFNTTVNYTLSNIFMLTEGFPSQIPVKAELIVTPGSTAINVSPSTKIDLKLEMTSLDFDVAFGLFNPQSGVGKTNEFPIDISSLIFKSTSNISTGIKFANPRLDIQLISNAGTYLKCKVDYIKAYIKENPSVSVEANFGGSSTVSEDINKPQMYTSVNHHYKQFNRNWGSTNLLFDLTKNYNRIEYKFTLSNNMDSVNAHPQSPCFLLSDTKIKTKAIATIPLYFEKGTSITYRDSIMDIGDNINKSLGKGTVDTAVFVLVVKNGIPMKFKFEIVDALDILGNQLPLSGLERTYTINSPEVNSKGLTTTITNTNISLKLGKSLLNDFKKIKKMRFKLSVDGKDINSAIQITKNNSIGVKAGIILKGNYTTNLDSIK